MSAIPEIAMQTPLTTSGITLADCATAELARGLCSAATITALPFMPAGTKIISSRGYRGHKPLTWTDRPPSEIVHTALLTQDNQVIDWTARQFWTDSDFPSITSLDAYKALWTKITIISPPHESYQP